MISYQCSAIFYTVRLKLYIRLCSYRFSDAMNHVITVIDELYNGRITAVMTLLCDKQYESYYNVHYVTYAHELRTKQFFNYGNFNLLQFYL